MHAGSALRSLDLSGKLICTNLLCEKIGGSCICRLASILERYKDVPLQLKLSANKLTEVPSVLYTLSRLEDLDLSHNSIRYIPWDDFTLRFQTLRRLDVSGNELESAEQKRAQLLGKSRNIQVTL